MSSTLTTRPFAGDQDFSELFAFVSHANIVAPPLVYWHIGNMMWTTCFATEDERRHTIRLWHRDGALQGFAWFEAPNEVTCFVHPSSRGTGELEGAIFDWAATLVDRTAKPEDLKLATAALANDTAYIDYLLAAGFQRGEPYMYHMVQPLDAPLPAPRLPPDWTIRAVGGEDEWPERVELHRDVWHPSKMSLEKYGRLRAFPQFEPDLDLVAVAPDGTLASYTIGWLDRTAGIGLFEPVGTREAYRRQGLSTAVIREGLRRMQERGARSAWISTGAQNSALTVYQSLGFQPVADLRFTKPLL